MSTEPDEEALSWAGDSQLDLPPRAGAASGDESDEVAEDATQGSDARPVTGSVLLVVYGIIGGIYLLYTVGWVIAITRDPFSMATLFAEIMSQFGEFLAIAAPAVWMATTFLLTRGRSTVTRLGWLLAGVVLLVPVPLVLGGF
ncbi:MULTISPECIES: hypothetical protein [unclassified Salinibacterium]|uniref:hypothetical protein n=1 Tax=unclassified Salinibacterium TaxID=2632331 RepID=UPI001423F5C0|nr:MULTISPECIES: hypothetical protein [unclassified Salinibacterium]